VKKQMMKKAAKLQLSRETLRTLEGAHLLKEALGGTGPSWGCTNNCTGPNCQVH